MMPLGMHWQQAFLTDRPTTDPNIPLVIWYGVNDATVTPDRARCGVDRICQTAMSTQVGGSATCADNLTLCVHPSADHSSILAQSNDWVRLYLQNNLLGDPAPPACTSLQEAYAMASTMQMKTIMPPACNQLPSNNTTMLNQP